MKSEWESLNSPVTPVSPLAKIDFSNTLTRILPKGAPHLLSTEIRRRESMKPDATTSIHTGSSHHRNKSDVPTSHASPSSSLGLTSTTSSSLSLTQSSSKTSEIKKSHYRSRSVVPISYSSSIPATSTATLSSSDPEKENKHAKNKHAETKDVKKTHHRSRSEAPRDI